MSDVKYRLKALEKDSGGDKLRYEILFHDYEGVYRDHSGDEYVFVAPLRGPIDDPRGGYWRNERTDETVIATIFSPESLRLRI